MKIIEYEKKHCEAIKALLVELQEYVVTIDNLGTQIISKDYRDIYYKHLIKSLKQNNGKMYLAIVDNQAVGLIAGTLVKLDKVNKLTTDNHIIKGQINELIVSKKVRNKGIGAKLMKKMETYFKHLGCRYVFIEVFGPNVKARQFYFNSGYEITNYEVGKKI